MRVDNKDYRTIWYNADTKYVEVIDQRLLPFKFEIVEVKTTAEMAKIILEMYVRGAGLIGASAAWGLYLATKENNDISFIEQSAKVLAQTRPTAVNLQAALDKMLPKLRNTPEDNRLQIAKDIAQQISDDDASSCKRIGELGYDFIKNKISKGKNRRINILTHCNAGWLAFVDYGSALAPIYEAYNNGMDIHVYVDETRPRNQGARLTAWELGKHGVPHTLIADNVGGHLMQHGMVDMVIVGADRVANNGDVANKIGTYLKALAAHDNNVPFVVAFPSTTFDSQIENGVEDIPIEMRDTKEVLYMLGEGKAEEESFRIAPEFTKAVNYGFDVTPARLINAYFTENGIFESVEELLKGEGSLSAAFRMTKCER